MTTVTCPADAVRTHPDVGRALNQIHGAVETATDLQGKDTLNRIAHTLRSDPTLVLLPDSQRTWYTILELRRQLGPLSRQAGLARERIRILADPTLTEEEREKQLTPLGKINPDAIERLDRVRAHLKQAAQEWDEAARPDWETPDHLAKVAHALLPSRQRLQQEAEELRAMLRPAAALAPHDPTVEAFFALADQMNVLVQSLPGR